MRLQAIRFPEQHNAQLSGTGLDWFLRGEGIYVGSRYASSLNLAETGDSFDLNLRAGLENERYSIGVFVQNVFDDDTFESPCRNGDCATNASCVNSAFEAVLPRQCQYGLTLQRRFQSVFGAVRPAANRVTVRS